MTRILKGKGKIRWYPEARGHFQTEFHNELKEERQGVMLHYDGSSTDEGALSWLQDSRSRVSYHYLILRDGSWASFAPLNKRAWHAGYCKPSDDRFTYSDGNSAFYGVSIASGPGEVATVGQILTTAFLVRSLYKIKKWYPKEEAWRLVSHASEAVYGPNHPKSGERGRKIDPEGPDKNRPILSVNEIRQLLPSIQM